MEKISITSAGLTNCSGSYGIRIAALFDIDKGKAADFNI